MSGRGIDGRITDKVIAGPENAAAYVFSERRQHLLFKLRSFRNDHCGIRIAVHGGLENFAVNAIKGISLYNAC